MSKDVAGYTDGMTALRAYLENAVTTGEGEVLEFAIKEIERLRAELEQVKSKKPEGSNA